MEKKARRMPDWFCLLLCILMLVPWLWFLISYFQDFHYRFPVFAFPRFLLTALNLLIPFVPIAVCGVFAFKRKINHPRTLSAVCLVVFLLLIICCFFVGLGEAMYAPTIWSETTDVENFGQYDDRIAKTLHSDSVRGFPREIPVDAQDVQYSYFYMSASREFLYLTVSWQYDDAEAFAQAVSDYPQEDMTRYDSDTEIVCHYTGGTTANGVVYESWIQTAAIFEEESNRVHYVLTTIPEWLPMNSGEVSAYPDKFLNTETD